MLEHQIYIANEVSSRMAPRVLLADEVGLGKTIEAGLILHSMILNGRIQRTLIVVPDALLHQWLVELVRRFNLRFTLIDDAFLQSLVPEDSDEAFEHPVENPFDQNSLVLCGLSTACRAETSAQINACQWDMLVVDEAHHLFWSREAVSPEYACVEQWAECANGVLLLTATPEQLGQEGHFARLRLLDPARFHSLDNYLADEAAHSETVSLVDALIEQKTLEEHTLQAIEERLTGVDNLRGAAIGSAERREAIDQLVDQYGTGRILFRNTRANVSGFPRRLLHSVDLENALPATKLTWLAGKIRELAPAKVLVICAQTKTAIETAKQLQELHGLLTSVFHENLSLLERDRAAAWFADSDDGARVMICSEIGSEGRNFQFLHHLVLLDLPDNPDLLEQRIGRLDRIGQQFDIDIHVPAALNSPEARLRDWYHRSLNAFEVSCVTGHYVRATFSDEFERYILGEHESPDDFILRCETLHSDKQNELSQGRNRLLEINACREEIAGPLIAEIEANERDDDLSQYLEQAFDCYGVEIDEHSLHNWIVTPGDHLQVEAYPELPEDGITITTRRDIALSREDMQFVTWEHPLLRATFDLVLNGDKGSVAVCALKMPQLPPRSILMEALFETQCVAPADLGASRFLPHSSTRMLVDQSGREYGDQIPASRYSELLESVAQEVATQMIDMTRDTLKKQIATIEQLVGQRVAPIRSAAIQAMHAKLDPELARLRALQKRNPTIRQDECDALEGRIEELEKRLAGLTLQLSALRVIYTH
ncbi:MAG: helicase-related protein [Pseudomonadota bacterium]